MRDARNAILNAAIGLFARKGYAACSIREICEAAGITKPVLYYYFRSKEHLYQELMLDLFNQSRKNLLQVANFHGSLRERLVLYVSTGFRQSRRNPEGVRFLFRMMFAPEEGYPYFNYLEEFQRERKILAGFIREGIRAGKRLPDADLTATALMGLVLTQILEYLFTGKRTLTRRNAEKIVDLLLRVSESGKNSIPIGTSKRGQ